MRDPIESLWLWLQEEAPPIVAPSRVASAAAMDPLGSTSRKVLPFIKSIRHQYDIETDH